MRKLSQDEVHVNLVPKGTKPAAIPASKSKETVKVGDSMETVKQVLGKPEGSCAWREWTILAYPGGKPAEISLAYFRDGVLTANETSALRSLPANSLSQGSQEGEIAKVWGQPDNVLLDGDAQAWTYVETHKLHLIVFEEGVLKSHEETEIPSGE